MTPLSNNHRLVTIICPSCNGNSCGICGHIGKLEAKEYNKIEAIEPLPFKSNKGDFDFEPQDFDDQNFDDQDFEFHHMKSLAEYDSDAVVLIKTIPNPSKETKKRFYWRARYLLLKIKAQEIIEKIKKRLTS